MLLSEVRVNPSLQREARGDKVACLRARAYSSGITLSTYEAFSMLSYLPLSAPPGRLVLHGLLLPSLFQRWALLVLAPSSRLEGRSRGSLRCSTLRLAQRQCHLAVLFRHSTGGTTPTIRRVST